MKLVIILDNAPYFIAKRLKKQADVRCLLLEYFPPYASEMNPVEQFWRQLNDGRANRLYHTLPDLKTYLTTKLPSSTHQESTSTSADPYSRRGSQPARYNTTAEAPD